MIETVKNIVEKWEQFEKLSNKEILRILITFIAKNNLDIQLDKFFNEVSEAKKAHRR